MNCTRINHLHMSGASMSGAHVNRTCPPVVTLAGNVFEFLPRILAACIVFAHLAAAAVGALNLVRGGRWLWAAVRNLCWQQPTAGHSARANRERMRSSNWMYHDLD